MLTLLFSPGIGPIDCVDRFTLFTQNIFGKPVNSSLITHVSVYLIDKETKFL